MWAVIDAQIFQQYFACSQRSAACGLTCDPSFLFDLASEQLLLFLDEGEIIEHEWRNVVDRLWFDTWLAGEFARGKIRTIAVPPNGKLRRELLALGFPVRRSRDIWYVRTACEAKVLAGTTEEMTLVSEDLDFYEPREKGAAHKRRMKILLASGGAVSKHLRREYQVLVACVATLLNQS